MVPDEYLGVVIDLCTQKRGVQKDLVMLDRAMLTYRLPLNEIVYDFTTALNLAHAAIPALIGKWMATKMAN